MVANSQSSGAKNYVKPYKLTIAKNASKKEIEAVLQVLKEKYNEQWTYENLTYNDDGDLITLNLIYREKEHSSSSYSYSGYGDPKGIGKIILFRNRDGTHGSVTEGEENFATLTEDYNTKSPFNKYATNPVEGKATQDAILKAQRAKIIVARRKMTKQLHEEREALLEERKQKRAQLSQQREEQIQERLKQIDSVRYFMEGKNPDGSILYNTFTTSSGSPFGSSEIPEGSVLDKIESSTTDEALEKIKHSFADKGLEITFKDLERNDKGLITNIAVSLKNRTTSGSATFNVSSDAIPDIFIGQMPINIRF